MPIYSVRIPADGSDPASAVDRAVFLREGFSWPAFLFGPLWLLGRRLWRLLVVWCIGALIVGLAISHELMRDWAAVWFYLAAALFLGLEGRAFVGAAMERRGFRLVDIAGGQDLTSAETGFFARWFVDAPSAPLAAPAAARRRGPASDAHVIGLFPEAGG
jgi:Protein of unknown function (DUF2628)